MDPALQGLLRKLDDDRYRRMTENARYLHDAGHLRAGLGVTAAADLMWSVTSPEMYELLILRQRWPLESLADWIHDTLTGMLATDAPGTAHQSR